MGPLLNICRFWALSFLITCFAALSSGVVWAQDNPAFTPPNFSVQDLEARKTALSANADLSEEQRGQITTSLDMASERLTEATRQSERRAQFETAIENAEDLEQELEKELQAAQEALETGVVPIAEMIGADALFELEKDLFAKESDLAELETRLLAIQETLNILNIRQSAAPQELAEARAALSDLQTRANALGEGELEAVSNARRTEVQARIWYRRNQIKALEQEILTLPTREGLLIRRRAVTDIRAQILRSDVARLSSRTGQKRLNEAREQRNKLAADIQVANISHPLVLSYAQENLEFADKIADIAAETPDVSQATASAKGRLVDVENDLNAAQNLVGQGRLDREAGDTLRRLGDQLQSPASIRADIRETQNKRVSATRERIIAQEDLRDLRNGLFDFNNLIEQAQLDDPSVPLLTELEREIFSTIIDTRRDLLRQISTLSNTRINSVSELQSAQQSLLGKDVKRRAALIGRVTQDSVWHTPVVIAGGLFNALPYALTFLLLAVLFWLSDNPDRLIEGLANGFAYLSVFALIFGAWMRWDREAGLFDVHFNLPADLRVTIARNLRWFVPVMGTVSFFLAVTNDMVDENIEEGFSVFVFILSGIALMVFAARILWAKREEISNLIGDRSAFIRYRGLVALAIIGMPFLTIAIAAAGYYESADALLSRMFLTGMLVLLTYVIYGAIRRAIVVAQRQLKYRQALQKREAELKARRDKEAAEERGEEM